jgi:hypothetical protein
MIDLDAASAELGESLSHVHPDVDGVRARAARRQRTRRIVGGLAALVLLAGGAAAAAAVAGDEEASEGVIAGPGPEDTGDPDTEPTDPWSDSQWVDVGDLRVRVPDDWRVIDAATDPSGGCGGPQAVVIGESAPNIRCRVTALRILELFDGGAGSPTQSVNGIPYQEVAAGVGTGSTVHLPTLGRSLVFADGVDVDAILTTIEPSARAVALEEATTGVIAGWQVDPTAWQQVSFRGISIRVPAGWPVTPGEALDLRDPCLGWALSGPSAIVGSVDRTCGSGDLWRPRDGAWLLPATGEVDTSDGTWEELAPFDLGDGRLSPVVQVGGTSTVLQVVLARPGTEPVLLRVGLGPDGHIAGSILSSIRLADSGPNSDQGAIVLPCGTVAVPDRSVLDLPEDLVVDPQPGMGGWAPGTGEEVCAVNLTDVEDPASHVTFVDGALPFAIGTELGGATVRAAGVRWGTIEDGYGAQVTRGSDQFHVLAYGLSEEGAAALFTSLALG